MDKNSRMLTFEELLIVNGICSCPAYGDNPTFVRTTVIGGKAFMNYNPNNPERGILTWT